MTCVPARGLRAALSLLLLALNALVAVLALRAPTLVLPIPATSMTAEVGHNVIALVAVTPPFPYIFAFPSPSDPDGSPATVTEDSRPLGPAHALHSDIRAEGAGRFSFWSGAVYFSTSDNSDPRTNGRTYQVVARSRLPHRVALGLAALDLLCLAAFWRTIAQWLRRCGPALGAALTALAALWIAAAAAGWLPPLSDGATSAINGAMALSIAIHLLLGLGLLCAVFATGLGLLLWAGQGPHGLDDLLLRAFLPGTLVIALAALLAVVASGGAALAAVACAAAAAPLARYRPALGELRRALAPALFCFPAVALYAVVLSLRFHGPSAALAGAPYGDETIYAGWAADVARGIAPVSNLAVEGLTTPYGNLLPSLLAAPLLGVRWFDPYLFFGASLSTLSLLSLALTVPSLVRACRDRLPGTAEMLAFAGLAAAAFRSPSVLVESPPFAFLLPVIVSTLHLASPGRAVPARPWGGLVAAALGTAISKVVALPVLAFIPAPEAAGQLLRRASRRQAAAAAAFGALALMYVAIAMRTYLPLFSRLGGLGPPSWEAIVRYHLADPLAVACVVARDFGALLLAAAWARSRATGLKLGVWAGVGLGFLMPFLFHTSLTTAVLVTALAVAAGLGPGRRARPWLLAAAALMLPQSVLAEGGGPAVTLAWFAAVGSLTAAAAELEAADAVRAVGAGRGAAAAVALLCVAVLWGAGAGAVRLGPEALPFTPDMRDIWRAARRHTPPGALLFTDQTGDTESRLGGWDDFALTARRQFFIASWAIGLRSDPEGRRARLDENARVLSGRLAPDALALSRRYDGYYAVLAASKPAPPGFAPLYRNASFALYRIESR